MSSHEEADPVSTQHREDDRSLYRRIVEGLEGQPAYLLVFGVAALFVVSGVGTSIAGVARGELWQSVIGLLSFVAALIAVFLVVNRVETPHRALQPAQNLAQVQLNQVRGHIDEPTARQNVTQKIECSGWAKDFAAGVHLWLATEVGGSLWPKGSEVYVGSDGRWTKTIFEDGAVAEFSLSLFVANADAHRAILKWLEAGQKADKYVTLSGVIGMDRLDRVDGLRLSKT